MKHLLPLLCCLALANGLRAQNCPAPGRAGIPAPIRQINFSYRYELLPAGRLDDAVKAARGIKVDPSALDRGMAILAEGLADRVRAAYQNEGYFTADVIAQAVKVDGAEPPQYDLAVQVRDAGPQYRLGDLNIVKATVFPTQQLRDLFPIQQGQIFSRVKIAKGLEALRRLYGTQGYINVTVVPTSEFDDNSGLANLTIDVDEGKQFRLRSMQMLGLDVATRARVLSALDLKPGDVYNAEAWERVLQVVPNLPPHGTDADTTVKRLDERKGLVDILMDFRAPNCPYAMDPAKAEQQAKESIPHPGLAKERRD